MKEGWKYERLGNVASYVNGFAFKPSDWTNEGLPIIRIQNLTEQNTTFNYCKRTDIPQKYLVTDGDVLISWSATLGVFEWKRGLALLNQHIFKVVFDKIKINKQFFIYTIQTSIEEMSRHTNGATMRHIRKGDFDNIKIPLPSLSEQERIVAFLDAEFEKIDQLKANAAAQLQAAKDLFQAALKEMLTPKEGWMEKALKEIGKTQTGCTPSMSHREYYNEDYIPFIKPSEINCNGLGEINYDTQMLSKKGAEVGRIFEKGSIFMVCIGATIGKLGISDRKVSCNQQINVLTPSEGYCNKFLYYAMLDSRFNNVVIKEGKSSQATLPIISKGKWEALKIFTPQYSEQVKITKVLEDILIRVNTLQSNYNQTLTLCNDLKQSLLKSIFE